MKKQRLKKGYVPAPEAPAVEKIFSGKVIYCPDCTGVKTWQCTDDATGLKSFARHRELVHGTALVFPVDEPPYLPNHDHDHDAFFGIDPTKPEPGVFGVEVNPGTPQWKGVSVDVGDAVAAFTKNDGGKNQLDLLPFDALFAVSEVLTFGAKLYAPGNWAKGAEWSRYQAAMLRHYVAFAAGDDWDKESGLPHLAHLTCDALFLLAHQLRKIGTDDRKERREGK